VTNRERVLPHEQLQDHLSARYFITPSQLYSVVRPAGRNGELQVPVVGDWITIGVLAEKSEIRLTNTIGNRARKPPRNEDGGDKDEDADDDEQQVEKGGMFGGKARENMARMAKVKEKLAKADEQKEKALLGDDDDDDKSQKPLKPRRYITFKLVDLGTKGAGGGSGVLDLRLFEANSSLIKTGPEGLGVEVRSTGVKVARDDSEAAEKRREYKGGSGGAYERFWREREGAVIAILNPKIMKPREVRYR
jgi:minichromosome maintenance protein 10